MTIQQINGGYLLIDEIKFKSSLLHNDNKLPSVSLAYGNHI